MTYDVEGKGGINKTAVSTLAQTCVLLSERVYVFPESRLLPNSPSLGLKTSPAEVVCPVPRVTSLRFHGR